MIQFITLQLNNSYSSTKYWAVVLVECITIFVHFYNMFYTSDSAIAPVATRIFRENEIEDEK